ncbi:MAG: hypothetical protein ACLFRY_01605 [Spirochaetia bacterium]
MTKRKIFHIGIVLALFFAAAGVYPQDADSLAAGVRDLARILDEEYRVTEEDLESIEELSGSLEGTIYTDLAREAEMLLLVAEEKYALQHLPRDETVPSPLEGVSFGGAEIEEGGYGPGLGLGLALGTSFLSLGAYNLFTHFSNVAYDRYITTTSPSNAATLQSAWRMYGGLSTASLVVSAAAFVSAIPFLINTINAPPAGDFTSFSVKELEEYRNDRIENLPRADRRVVRNRNFTEAAAGVGFGLAAISWIPFVMADVVDGRQERISSGDPYADSFETFDTIYQVTGGTLGGLALTSLVTGLVSVAAKPDLGRYTGEIEKIDAELAARTPGDEEYERLRRSYLLGRIEHLKRLKAEAREDLLDAKTDERLSKGAVYTMLGFGLVSLGGMTGGLIAGNTYWERYLTDPGGPDAVGNLRKMDGMNILANVMALTAGASLSSSVIIAFVRPKPKEINRRIRELDDAILKLERELAAISK